MSYIATCPVCNERTADFDDTDGAWLGCSCGAKIYAIPGATVNHHVGTCYKCNTQFELADDYLGRKLKCECGLRFYPALGVEFADKVPPPEPTPQPARKTRSKSVTIKRRTNGRQSPPQARKSRLPMVALMLLLLIGGMGAFLVLFNPGGDEETTISKKKQPEEHTMKRAATGKGSTTPKAPTAKTATKAPTAKTATKAAVTVPPEPVAVEASIPANAVLKRGLDIEVTPNELTKVGSAAIGGANSDLVIKSDGDGFGLQCRVETPGTYQVWVTYYCEKKRAQSTLDFNGVSKTKDLFYMGKDSISKFYGSNDRPIRTKRGQTPQVEPYYFREYWGSFPVTKGIDMKMTYQGGRDIRVHKVEFNKEGRRTKELEPLLFAAINFYDHMQLPNGLTRCTYDAKRDKETNTSSVATCGIALMAFAINHQLGRDPKAADKALNLLRVCNHKVPGCKPMRHRTGYFMHFVNAQTGKGRSEYSTIDTSILMSGALIARNAFNDPRITAEADQLWNSIDWTSAVVQTDPSRPRFAYTGANIDGTKKGATSMYNEYIILAWFCQMWENQQKGAQARKYIMPDIDRLPKQVFRNRILLATHIQPSFLVQFPFYMSNLCDNERFFSFVAAQGAADRTYCIDKYKDRSAWGVSPGCTPEKGYAVRGFAGNPENTVGPRMVAGFTPVLPIAAEDLYLRWKNPENRQKLKFGTILPRFVPGNKTWKPSRIAGVDFSALLCGLAAHHPKIGADWWRKNTKFTFKKK